MRKLFHCGCFALAVAGLAACTDAGPNPVTPPNPPVPPLRARASAPGQLRPPGVRRNPRAFTLKVDKQKKGIQIQTISSCNPEMGTGCEVPCDPTADLCDNPQAQVDEALDAGQLILGDVTESSGECPREMTGGIWFQWRKHDFVVWGTFERQLSIRSWPWGEAEYALPAGPHESQDNRATIWNGVVKAKCYGYADSGGGFSGIMNWTWLRGNAEEHEPHTGSDGGAGDEISYYNALNGTLTWTPGGHVSTGDSEVDAVVNKWLDTGHCSEGWVIEVDGIRVC